MGRWCPFYLYPLLVLHLPFRARSSFVYFWRGVRELTRSCLFLLGRLELASLVRFTLFSFGSFIVCTFRTGWDKRGFPSNNQKYNGDWYMINYLSLLSVTVTALLFSTISTSQRLCVPPKPVLGCRADDIDEDEDDDGPAPPLPPHVLPPLLPPPYPSS